LTIWHRFDIFFFMEAARIKIPEKNIQAAIKDYLRVTGWYVWKNPPSIYSGKGLTDLEAVKDGVVLYIEVKSEDGVLSKDQKAHRDNLVRAGAKYIMARDADEVIKYVENLFRSGGLREIQGRLSL
jgi:hypothetical protein